MVKENRFSALRQLRDQRQEEGSPDPTEQVLEETPHEETREEEPERQTTTPPPAASPTSKKHSKVVSQGPDSSAKPKKRGPGRPPGRRSNPDYTQISAYIPLERLLEVQDELAEERREKMQRTPRPVSDLMEELLASWLKTRKRKNTVMSSLARNWPSCKTRSQLLVKGYG